MTSNGITFAWTLDGKGGGVRIADENIAEEIRNVGLAWVHINDNDFKAREWIEKEVSYLDRIILDALLAEETHPRYIDYQDGMLLILRGVNLNPDQEPEDMVSLRGMDRLSPHYYCRAPKSSNRARYRPTSGRKCRP